MVRKTKYMTCLYTLFLLFYLERDVLFEMLQAAHEDSEEARLSKVRWETV